MPWKAKQREQRQILLAPLHAELLQAHCIYKHIYIEVYVYMYMRGKYIYIYMYTYIYICTRMDINRVSALGLRITKQLSVVTVRQLALGLWLLAVPSGRRSTYTQNLHQPYHVI